MFQSVIKSFVLKREKRILFLASLCFGFFICAPSLTAIAADPAILYMKTVSKALIMAGKTGSIAKFEQIIKRHSDLPKIGYYSLGSYASQLPKTKKARYYKGVAGFMARYFASQSSSYKVERAKIFSPSHTEGRYTMVETQVFLTSGASYRVLWRLSKRGKGFKISDVRVMGFWLTPFQRTMFGNYIDKQGGNVNALVLALSY